MSDKLKEFESIIKGDLAGKLKKWDRPVFGYTSPKIIRKEGEVWEDSDGREWTVKDGITQNLTKLDSAKTPWWCPKCEKTMGHKFDTKFWRLYGMCYDCTIAWHTQMKLDGTYDAWESKTLRDNERGYLKDMILEIEDYIKNFTAPQVVHERGWEELAPKESFGELFEHLNKQKQSMLDRIKELDRMDAEE
jgi:hypothetical protein